MSAMAFQITTLMIVYPTAYSGTDQRYIKAPPICKQNVSAIVRSIWCGFLTYAVFQIVKVSKITLILSAATYINEYNHMNFDDKFERGSRFSFWRIGIIFHCDDTQEFPLKEYGWFGQSANSTRGSRVADWSSTSLNFVRGTHWSRLHSPHKGPVTRKTFPFDDVIM